MDLRGKKSIEAQIVDAALKHDLTKSKSADVGLYDLLNEYGDGVSALIYGGLFLPDFVEVDGTILARLHWGDEVKEMFRARRKENVMSLEQLEASFNSLEIPYLFANRRSSDEDDILLGQLIAEAWRSRLAFLFPGRSFEVLVLVPPEAEDTTVEFREIRQLREIRP